MRIFLAIGVSIIVLSLIQINKATSEYLAKTSPNAQISLLTGDSGVDEQVPDYCGLEAVECENERPAGVEKEIISHASEQGFGDSGLLIKLSKGESGLNPKAENLNTDGTWDKGVFQINDCHVCEWQMKKFGKEKVGCIKSEDRKDVKLATEWTIRKIRAGGLMIWVYARKAGLQFNG